MKIELIDDFPPELDQLAAYAERVTFYQTRTWIDALRATFPGMRFRCLLAREGGDHVGYLPFFMVRKGPFFYINSMPFETYGGPVTIGEDRIYRELILNYLGLLGKGRVYGIRWVDFFNAGMSMGIAAKDDSTHMVDLRGGLEKVWMRFEKSKRRQARKAEKEGLRLVEAESRKEVEAYYEIYRDRLRPWGEWDFYPKELFLKLVEDGGEKVKLFLVYRGEELLGGHMNFYFGNMVTAWNGMTKREAARYQASSFLYVRLLSDACRKGFEYYNLGGSLGKASLEEYKASLGGEVYNYLVFQEESLAFRLARRIRSLVRGNR